MAKKSKGVVVESGSNLPAVAERGIVSIAVDLNKDDVAAVLMSRLEMQIKQAIKVCTDKATKLQKQAEGLANQLNKAQENAAAAHYEDAIATLKETAKALGCKSIEATTNCYGFVSDEKALSVRLVVTGNNPSFSCDVRSDAKVPAEMKKLMADQDSVQQSITDNQREWLDWRRKLADLPAAERRAKALVAEERLSQSDEGMQLLDTLDGGLEDTLKLLGVG